MIAWATRDAPLVELGSIHLPHPPFPGTVEPRPGSVFSWAMGNVWDTNFPLMQGGETTFAYAVSSAAPGDGSRGLGVRTGAAVAQPLVAVVGAARAVGGLASGGNLCALDRGDVEIVGLTASRRGHDLVVLLQSFANEETEVRVEFPDLPVARVWAGTFLERNLRELEARCTRVRIGAGDLIALAIDLAAR